MLRGLEQYLVHTRIQETNETLATGSVGKARRKVKNLGNSSEHDCVDHNKLWKILKEVGILDHLTCLLRDLYAGQEAT